MRGAAWNACLEGKSRLGMQLELGPVSAANAQGRRRHALNALRVPDWTGDCCACAVPKAIVVLLRGYSGGLGYRTARSSPRSARWFGAIVRSLTDAALGP